MWDNMENLRNITATYISQLVDKNCVRVLRKNKVSKLQFKISQFLDLDTLRFTNVIVPKLLIHDYKY